MMSVSVRALISARYHASSQPKERDDPFRLALVIEGGGMRAVTAGGMVSALEALGLRAVFDFVFGSSAGAVAGAYFVAGQARFGNAMFYQNLNSRAFIDFYRLLRRKPLMDTSYLIDRVMRFEKRLDIGAVLNGTLPLHIVATDIETGQPSARAMFDDPGDFFQFLKATVTMPLIGGGPVEFNGRQYFDGGLVQQVAVETAIAHGATHIVTLLTRRRSELDGNAGQWRHYIEGKVLDTLYGQRVGELYRCREGRIERSLDLCFSQKKQQENSVLIETVVLPEDLNYLSRLTTEGALLRQGEQQAFETILKLGLTNRM